MIERGFSSEVRANASNLVAKITQFEAVPSEAIDPNQQTAAVAALWGWYLEWSSIARTVIKDRRTLRRLGFLQQRSEPDGEQPSVAVPSTEAHVDPLADTHVGMPTVSSTASNAASSNGASNGAVSNGVNPNQEAVIQVHN